MQTVQDQKKIEALRDWFNNPQIRIDKLKEDDPHFFSAYNVMIQGMQASPVMVVYTEQEAQATGLPTTYTQITEIHHSDGTPFIVYHDMQGR